MASSRFSVKEANRRIIREIPRISNTPSPSPTGFGVPPSVTPTVTPSISITPSITPSISLTPTPTPTPAYYYNASVYQCANGVCSYINDQVIYNPSFPFIIGKFYESNGFVYSPTSVNPRIGRQRQPILVDSSNPFDNCLDACQGPSCYQQPTIQVNSPGSIAYLICGSRRPRYMDVSNNFNQYPSIVN